jgi:hypothetical protein
MTPKEQRIAIAEARNWTEISDWGAGGITGKHPTEPWVEVIPDYLKDLNAMHEEEKTLNFIKAAEYARILTSIAWQSEQPDFAPMTATAAQRAEAFLRTIGKWTNNVKVHTPLPAAASDETEVKP